MSLAIGLFLLFGFLLASGLFGFGLFILGIVFSRLVIIFLLTFAALRPPSAAKLALELLSELGGLLFRRFRSVWLSAAMNAKER